MSKVTDELRGHRFDDIEEYDNPLPRWWLGIFWVTIAFALVYVPWVHLGEGNTIADEYGAEMELAKARMAASQVEWVEADLLAHCQAGEGWKAKAQGHYDSKCAACHRGDGGGLVGPAFTDDATLHGYGHADIARVIFDGVPAKGMIPWGKQLAVDDIRDLTCLVRAMRGAPVENPKAPQGEPIR